jgi:hypothetical protein
MRLPHVSDTPLQHDLNHAISAAVDAVCTLGVVVSLVA